MRILWLAPYPVKLINGLQLNVQQDTHPCTWIVNQSKLLVQRYSNVDLHLLTETCLIKKDTIIEQNNITFHVIRSGSSIPFLLHNVPSHFGLYVFAQYKITMKKMLEVVAKINPDLIHAHGTEAVYSSSTMKLDSPALISVQGIMNKILQDKNDISSRIIKQKEIETISNGKYFIAKSEFSKQFIRLYNKEAKIFNLENPVHESFYKVNNDILKAQNVLFIGSIIKEKGIEELLYAFAKTRLVNLHIIGIGIGTYIKYLKSIADKLNISDRVFWMGYKSSSEIAQEFNNALMLVLPSYMETSPNVISEALVSGIPVVATRVGGIPYMIDDKRTGLLFDPGNINDLSDNMNLLIENVEYRKSVQQNIKKNIIDTYNPKIVTEKLFSIYRSILGRD